MANRFPLVVDTDDGNKLKELPAGDQLDLANSGIANLTNLSVGGNINSQTLTTVGNTTLGGDLSVSGTLTVDGDAIGVQVQSDWNETDVNDPAFIRNKPDIGGGSETLAGLLDTSIINPQNDEVLLYFNNQWVNAPAPDSGSARTDAEIRALIYQGPNGIDVIDQAPSGQGLIEFGKDPNVSNEYGKIIYTPPLLPTSTSDLINNGDGDPDDPTGPYIGANSLGIDDSGNKYLKSNEVIGFGRLTSTVVNGQVQVTFDESGLLTIESDTLATVTARGASTSLAIEADAFNQAPTSTSTNTLKDVSIETLDILTSITSTNGNFTATNGNITAGGNIQGLNITATNNLTASFIIGAVNISNTTGDMELTVPAGSRIDVTSGRLRIAPTTLPPTSPEIGEIIQDGSAFYAYVNDDGTGSAGPVTLPAFYSVLGLQLPAFEEDNLPTGVEGMLIWNLTQSRVDVYNGTSFVAV